jgi:hypothetical protein
LTSYGFLKVQAATGSRRRYSGDRSGASRAMRSTTSSATTSKKPSSNTRIVPRPSASGTFPKPQLRKPSSTLSTIARTRSVNPSKCGSRTKTWWC